MTRYTTGRKPWPSEAPRELQDEASAVRQKLFYLALVVIAVFGILTIQLGRMQLANSGRFTVQAESNRLRQTATSPPRGLIYDRNGKPLVENRATYSAAVVPADIPEGRESEIFIALQELVGVPAGDVADQVAAQLAANDPFTPVVVKEDIGEAKAFALRENLAQLPGTRVVVEPRRYYPEGPLFSNILGFVRRIDSEEYERLKGQGYQMADKLGKTGIELTYESLMRGLPGAKIVEADASGRELRTLDELPSVPGSSLVLSVDVELQHKVAELLQAGMGASKNAAAVVMDVRTGEVLALVSLPSYDNNIFTGVVEDSVIQALLNDPGKPLVNHAITEMYPPGSTFKQITGLAALQEGIATPSTQITSLGQILVPNQYDPSIVYRFRDWSALGTLDFYRGVAMSSDVYFYYLAGGFEQNGREVFRGLGATLLADWSRRFGLGTPTGIDIPGESDGLVPDPKWKEETYGQVWTVGDTYNMGIGQGFVLTTPIQMAVVTAAVANGGDVLVPHLLKEIRDGNGNISPARQGVKSRLNIDPRNINIMREAMRQAVFDGTARTGGSRFTAVAGKTGTAEFGEQRPDGSYQEHGWFTGYAPFNDPQIAVAVFLETGNGAGTAAPVGAKIFDYYFGQRTVAETRQP